MLGSPDQLWKQTMFLTLKTPINHLPSRKVDMPNWSLKGRYAKLLSIANAQFLTVEVLNNKRESPSNLSSGRNFSQIIFE